MNSTWRNVGLLAACQAMLMSTNSTLAAIQGLTGLALAPHKALATLPVTCWIIGGALSTMLASLHMKRAGRQRGLTSGVLWSIAGALVCAAAVWERSFWVLCGGSLVMGVANAYAQYYRFAAAAIGYGLMNFLMTSTPIAMQLCGHGFGDAAFVISSHVIAMFAPSFFTGPLIRRIGVLPVLFAGAILNLAAIGVALSGIGVAQFWVSLVLLGVGWNFLYIGGTTLLAGAYRPEERAQAQGANDQAI